MSCNKMLLPACRGQVRKGHYCIAAKDNKHCKAGRTAPFGRTVSRHSSRSTGLKYKYKSPRRSSKRSSPFAVSKSPKRRSKKRSKKRSSKRRSLRACGGLSHGGCWYRSPPMKKRKSKRNLNCGGWKKKSCHTPHSGIRRRSARGKKYHRKSLLSRRVSAAKSFGSF